MTLYDEPLPGAPIWVKSSKSFSNGNCIEVAALADGMIGVRHSKHPEGPVLRYTRAEWDAFIGGCKADAFDGFASGA